MANINASRVILGGLAAGIVIDIFEGLLHGVYLAPTWEQVMTSINRSPVVTTNALILYNLWGLVTGYLLVWVYAAIRPRFGPGPRTAFKAAAAVWLLAYALPTLGWIIPGIITVGMAMLMLSVAIVELIAAAMVGAAIYKEGGAAPAPAAV
jgi:hypothetical protein